MADQAEQAFVTTFLNTLSSQNVSYADDYQQPPENSLRRVPVLQVDVPPPPEHKQQTSAPSGSLSIIFKSLKPNASFTLSVQPTDTIASIKALLAEQKSAPPADVQRFLLKGKALADTKLLKEYNIKDNDTVNLMVKPGFRWDPSETSQSPSPAQPIAPSPVSAQSAHSLTLSIGEESKSQTKKHQRIPSVVLSPSPSNEAQFADKPVDIMLTLDAAVIPPSISTETLTTYHNTVAKPEFWDRLHSFLRSEFPSDSDALHAFEDFLRASKGTLTASEIAKIRDQVGVVGMAGT